MDGKARILFVDDEKRVLNSMRGLFRREFELFLTTEGSDAIRIARENSIDVVVADQRMPGMTGIEVLGKVKELSPKTVRILLTGYADPEAVEGSINIGEVFRFLSKPCPPKTLRETLQLAVEASRTSAPSDTPPPPQEAEVVATTSDAGTSAEPKANAVETMSRAPTSRAEVVRTAPVSQSDGVATASAPGPVVSPVAAAAHPAQQPVASTAAASAETTRPSEPVPPETTDQTGRQKRLDTGVQTSAAKPDSASWVIRNEAEDDSDTARDLPTLEPVPLASERLTRRSESANNRPEDAVPVAPTQATGSPSHWENSTTIVLSGDTSHEFRAPNFDSVTSSAFNRVGVVFFTVDPEFAETAMRAASGDRSVTLATTLAKVAETIEKKEAGVLVTDFTTNNSVLQRMLSSLKQLLPELVTIVASNSRDTTDMINLINHGQVFRYILKPIEPKKLMYEINAASIKHLDLAQSPELAKRHQVVDMSEEEKPEETLNQFVTRIRQLRAATADPTDSST